MIDIKPCTTETDFAAALTLVGDYLYWLDMDLSFQNIAGELSGFSAMYSPPNGIFLLAWNRDELVGGVGLRRIEERICEMKRLFVYDSFQDRGVGRQLCTQLIQAARSLGYETMRLDTLERMKSAMGLYTHLGFKEISPYRFNPDPTTQYLELDLTAGQSSGHP